MPAIILSSENESHLQQVIEIAKKLDIQVAETDSAPQKLVRKWAGSISKESAQLLLEEVKNTRLDEWDRQF